MKNHQETPQYNLDLKGNTHPILERIKYRISKFALYIEQFRYWRSPLVWFVIYLNIGLSVLVFRWFISNMNTLPSEIPLLLYQQDPISRFIRTPDIVYLLGFNLIFQLFTLYIGSKLYFSSKQISNLILIVSAVSNSALLISIYKMINILLP